MQPFGTGCQRGKRVRPHNRNQEAASHQGDQPGQAECDERAGQQPVTKALDSLEPLNGGTCRPAINHDFAANEIEHHQQADDREQCAAAIGDHRAFPKLPPGHAAVLNQHIGGWAAYLSGWLNFVVADSPPVLRVGDAAPGSQRRRDRRCVLRITEVLGAETVVDFQLLLASQDVFEGLSPTGCASFRFGNVLRPGRIK